MAGLSEKQWQVMCFGETSYDALICDGAVRSGKTSTESVAYILWAMEHFDRCNFIIGGASIETARRNVVNPILATEYLTERYSMTWAGRSNLLTVRNRDTVNHFYVFGGKDESSYRIVQGLTAAGCLLDEVVLMPRSFVEQCMARCSVEGAKFWLSCNPGSPSHWFFKEWVQKLREKNAYRIHFKLTDNPSLSDKTIERYERMYSGVFKQRYIDGDWVAAEGIVYPMWRDAIEERWRPDDDDPCRGYCLSIDYGTMNPFAAIKWMRDKGGKWHAVDELYYDGRSEMRQKTDADYVEDVTAFCADCDDERVETIVDPSAASFITALRRTGRFRVLKANNDVLDGIRDVSVCLQGGLIGISDRMDSTKAEFEAYVWDDKGDDKPVKANDHALDSLRYFVKTKKLVKPDVDYVSPFDRSSRNRIR